MIDRFADLCRKNSFVNTIAQYTYLNFLPALLPASEAGSGAAQEIPSPSEPNRPRVAFICDWMTWLDFHDQCQSIFLSPKFWKKQMDDFHPELLFCESAWEGDICGWPNWRGRIYRNRGVWFENRKILLDLLEYCHVNGIKTVFWNKEDPFIGNPRYDFVDTALRFDYLFTTAEECVPNYMALGHQRVYTLPFGVNTSLFSPVHTPPENGRVIFAGSWFGEFPQRCQDMCLLFDHVLEQGMTLDIYDRKSKSGRKNFRFPSRYRPYLHDSVPYEALPALLGQYEYALNVNSITDSHTMCSRRVLQMAACGMKLITNPSPAIEAMEGLSLSRQYAGGKILYYDSDAYRIAECYGTAQQFEAILNQTFGTAAAVPSR